MSSIDDFIQQDLSVRDFQNHKLLTKMYEALKDPHVSGVECARLWLHADFLHLHLPLDPMEFFAEHNMIEKAREFAIPETSKYWRRTMTSFLKKGKQNLKLCRWYVVEHPEFRYHFNQFSPQDYYNLILDGETDIEDLFNAIGEDELRTIIRGVYDFDWEDVDPSYHEKLDNISRIVDDLVSGHIKCAY